MATKTTATPQNTKTQAELTKAKTTATPQNTKTQAKLTKKRPQVIYNTAIFI